VTLRVSFSRPLRRLRGLRWASLAVLSACSLLHDAQKFVGDDLPAARDGDAPVELEGGVTEGGGGHGGDASSDAGSGPPTDSGNLALPYCARQTGSVFCDDFDEGALGAKWDDGDFAYGSLGTEAFVSGPRAMHDVIGAPAASEFTNYLAERLAVPSSANVRLAMAMRLDGKGPVYPFGLFCGANNYQVSFNLDVFEVTEQNGGIPYTHHPTTASFPLGQWRFLELSIKRSAGTVSMKVDGVVVLAETALAGKVPIASGDCTLALGVFYSPKNAQFDAWFDNVLVTTF